MRRGVALATVRHVAPRPTGRPHAMLVLHGLFGAARNWRTPILKLQERQPAIHMQALDLRNHGNSPHSEEMDFDVMTQDVREHIEREGLNDPKPVLLGHSLGGRVAMQVALKNADLLSGAIIVDVAPKPPPHPSVGPPVQLRLLDTMAAMPLVEIRSRRDAEVYMEKRVPDAVTRAFLLSNLVENAQGSSTAFKWRLNLPSIRRFVPHILAMDFPADTPATHLPTLFVVGGRSDYVLPSDHPRIKQLFLASTIATLPGAGHWVHSEQPTAFADKVSQWLDETKPFS